MTATGSAPRGGTLSRPVARVRGALSDPLLKNSWLILATTVLLAGAGSVFWIIAARLASSEDVGLAGSLVSTGEVIAVFSQLGLNIALISTMPSSRNRAGDALSAGVLVWCVGLVLATGYGLLLPVLSPRLASAVDPRWLAVVFGVLVASSAVNQLTDGMFLAIDRVASNLRINGFLLGAVKLSLPFLVAGSGAFGLYAAVGTAALVAAVASMMTIVRHTEGVRTLRPSEELWRARRFAGAGYLANSLYLTPQFVLPIVIINQAGSSASAVYFIGFQIVTLLNAVVYAISNAMHAEGARAPERVEQTARRAGIAIAWSGAVGIVAVVLAAPLLLGIFGSQYADSGVATLRVLALGTVGVGLNYWSIIRLRLAGHRRAMVLVQLFSTASIIALAFLLAGYGTVWVAAAWGIGQLAGGVLGIVVSLTVAPLRNGVRAQFDLALDEPAVGALDGAA